MKKTMSQELTKKDSNFSENLTEVLELSEKTIETISGGGDVNINNSLFTFVFIKESKSKSDETFDLSKNQLSI